MAAGFGGLIFLIVAIGLVGIRQIQDLSRVIGHLAKVDIPLQAAVADMKSANSKYAAGIRNYMFWRGAKYLEAAAIAGKFAPAGSPTDSFDRQLVKYASLAVTPQQKAWVETLKKGRDSLLDIGNKVVAVVEKAERARPEEKRSLEDSLAGLLMEFENRQFQIDAFLDDPVQKFNLEEIARQLRAAEEGRTRSVSLLLWSLLAGLLLGLETAALIYLRSKRESERREMLMRKVIRLEEEERNNLSLQVHDQMGQDLSALKIYLGLIEKELPQDLKDPKEKIDKTKNILDSLIDKTHNISELLRPPELEDLGLVESISAIVAHYSEMTGVNCNYEKPQQPLSLSPEHSLILYRLVQEALTNAAKYSNAKNISVSLKKSTDGVELFVSDDGVGFDYRESIGRPTRRKEDKLKLGLQGLRERIELLGGQMKIITSPGSGTKIEVFLFV